MKTLTSPTPSCPFSSWLPVVQILTPRYWNSASPTCLPPTCGFCLVSTNLHLTRLYSTYTHLLSANTMKTPVWPHPLTCPSPLQGGVLEPTPTLNQSATPTAHLTTVSLYLYVLYYLQLLPCRTWRPYTVPPFLSTFHYLFPNPLFISWKHSSLLKSKTKQKSLKKFETFWRYYELAY